MTVRLQHNGLGIVTAALVAYNTLKYFQWGVGSDPGSSSNTLGSTAGTTESRVAGTLSQATTTVANDTYQAVATLVAAESLSVTELGLFDAAGAGSPPTGGNLGWYAVFSTIGLAPLDSITFTAQVQFQ